MNHLAHSLLSFRNPDLLIGNYLGDWIKGRDWEYHPPGVQKGILLHRSIDAFTDAHTEVLHCKALIRPYAGRYAGPIVDILFDHLLALRWSAYDHEPLPVFAQQTYNTLQQRATELPALLQQRLPTMIEGDFLASYAKREGLAFVFSRFSKRLRGGLDTAAMLYFFHEHQAEFDAHFQVFFPELEKAMREVAFYR
jgi:acyl carrier protein phosphodiesterase